MLYNETSCYNSYYWQTLRVIQGFLLIIGFIGFILYSINLIIKEKRKGKNNNKFQFVPTFSSFALYLGGLLLLINKDISPIVGTFMVVIAALIISFMKKEKLYMLFTFILAFLIDKPYNLIFSWLSIILIACDAFCIIKKLPKEKKRKSFIIYIVFLLLFVIGFILTLYIIKNMPETYCWSLK